MYQRVLQIEQYPLTATLTFHANRFVPRFGRLLDNVIDQRLHMARRRAAGDHHIVGDGRHVANIELDDIFCLDVLECLDDQVAQLLAIHACCSFSYGIGLLSYWHTLV
jgi:hypothetical protein